MAINNIATNVTEILLTVASADRHDGTDGNGARIVATTNKAFTTNASSGVPITVEWLEMDWNGNSSSVGDLLENLDGDDAVTTYANLICHGFAADGSGQHSGIKAQARLTNVLNCVVYDITQDHSTSSLWGIALDNSSSSSANRIMNCTVYGVTLDTSTGTAYGIEQADNTAREMRNCISMGTGGTASGAQADYNPTSFATATVSHNMASDTSASGTGSIDSATDTDEFVSVTPSAEDFHLKNTSAQAYEAGTDLATTPTGVNFDIDNYDRDAGATTWSMGAHDGNNLRGGGPNIVSRRQRFDERRMSTYKVY